MSIINCLLPQRCCLCYCRCNNHLAICNTCKAQLPIIRYGCLCCAIPMPEPNTLCGTCLTNSYAFDRVVAPYAYASPVDSLVHGFKFAKKLYIGPIIATLLGDFLAGRNMPYPEVLIPMPLHPWRLYQRGFNQATEMAFFLAQRFDCRLETNAYRRVKNTPPQSGLSQAERQHNLVNAFDCYKPCRAKHVAIVDDVITTGSTANKLAGLIVKEGAELVEVWCFARAA